MRAGEKEISDTDARQVAYWLPISRDVTTTEDGLSPCGAPEIGKIEHLGLLSE
jgi:hypothetical protein